MPRAETHAAILSAAGGTQTHRDEISRQVVPGAHAVPLLDQAAWHARGKLNTPANITMLPLPPKGPARNPAETVWRYVPWTWLSNRVFDGRTGIRDARREVRTTRIAETGRIASLGMRKWPVTAQCP